MAKDKKVKIFEFEGKRITFDFGDGKNMVNATEMIKAFPGKRMNDFFQSNQTAEYIKALHKHLNISRDGNSRIEKIHNKKRHSTTTLSSQYPDLIKMIKGGTPEFQGTWIHERIALKFAAWLSPAFELWVYDKILELLTNGQTSLNPYPIMDKELLFYLKKVADNNLEAFQLLDHIIKRKEGLYLPPKE